MDHISEGHAAKLKVVLIGTDVNFKGLVKLKFGTMKPTIMLTIAALHGHQHTKLDTNRSHILWHDKHPAFFERICNDNEFTQKHCNLLQDELTELEEMKMCPAGMDECYVGRWEYKNLIDGNCNTRDCNDVLTFFCKRYMHKEWQSYLNRLDEAAPELGTLEQLCNVPGSIFMMAKMWKMEYTFTPPMIHVIKAVKAESTETEETSNRVTSPKEINQTQLSAGSTDGVV